jgi:hypothetical protein
MSRNTATAAAPESDPWDSPADFLKAKGWRCLGPVGWESALWLDPDSPPPGSRPTYTRQAVTYVDDEGNVQPVKVPDGRAGNGQPTVAVYQDVCVRPVPPMPMVEALRTAMERDARSALANSNHE